MYLRQIGLYVSVVLCVTTGPLFAQTLGLSDSFWVAVASYRSLANAEKFTAELTSSSVTAVKIVKVDTRQGEFFRVLTGPFRNELVARQRLLEMQRGDYSGAWLVVAPTVEAESNVGSVPFKDSGNAVDKPLPQTPVIAAATLPADVARTPGIELEADTTISRLPEKISLTYSPGQIIPLTRIDTELTPIKIDGHLDEPIWQSAPTIDDFVVIEPDTLVPGEHPTHLRVVYDDRGIYLAGDFFQPPESLVKRFSGRDARDNRDSFAVTLDTSGEGKYGFWFGINLGDSLMDGTVLPERVFTSDWDGPWYGRSQITDTGWSAEMFIPWGVVSMPASGAHRNMGLYVSRKVAYKDERWAWPALPPTQSKFMSSLQTVSLENVEPRQQYSVYPFFATGYDGVDNRQLYRAGVDVFWRPSSNFQLNATLNPDFGNVESDDVVINLSATETFFPEKRLFFLEGQEIFVASPRADTRGRGVGNQGAPYTMVNTRRIGGRARAPTLGANTTIGRRELVQPTELVGAFKTTGQIGGLRYGILGASEEDIKFDVLDNGQPLNVSQDGNDYGIARLLYENTQGEGYKAVGVLSTAVLNPERDAIAHGLDWHYLSGGGRLKVDGQYMMSDIDGIDEKGYGGFLDFELTYRQGLKHRLGLEYFDENIDINDLGFLSVNNQYRLRSALSWTSSSIGWARENQLDIRGFYQRSVTESLKTGAGIFISDRIRLNNLSEAVVRLNYRDSYFDDINSFGNGSYRIDSRVQLSMSWDSDSTKTWSYGLGMFYGQENLGGDRYSVSADVTWRPNDRFRVTAEFGYDDFDGWLLHQDDSLFATFKGDLVTPKISVDYFISARQQLRLSFQYIGIKAREEDFFTVPNRPDDLIATAKPTGTGARSSYDFSVSQFSLQARYRWEIAPLSDIFLVYSRQADLREALGEAGYDDLFDSAWNEPLVDVLVFKIRYRFGS